MRQPQVFKWRCDEGEVEMATAHIPAEAKVEMAMTAHSAAEAEVKAAHVQR